MDEDFRASFDDGKYTVIAYKDGRLLAQRYGEAWRDLTGDKLMYAMAYQCRTIQATEPDDCVICKGARGGVKGNENIIDNLVMCDYCSVTIGTYKDLVGLPTCRDCGRSMYCDCGGLK